jgi:flavodoxin
MNRTLIVYHSRTGHTRHVAQALARRLHADLDEIRIVQPLSGAAGYTMCAIEALAGLTPALRPAHRDPSAYELVVIGTPVWFWNLSSPVRSWLAAHPLKQRVAYFCTMGGSGSGRVFAAMAQLTGRAPVATLALSERELLRPFEDRLAAFAQRLHDRAPRRPARAPAHRPALPAAA